MTISSSIARPHELCGLNGAEPNAAQVGGDDRVELVDRIIECGLGIGDPALFTRTSKPPSSLERRLNAALALVSSVTSSAKVITWEHQFATSTGYQFEPLLPPGGESQNGAAFCQNRREMRA